MNQMLTIDIKYLGMQEYVEKGIFSIQAQASHLIRTATDQRGEQTINKDAKTVGQLNERLSKMKIALSNHKF